MSNISKERIHRVYHELITNPILPKNWYYGFLEAALVSNDFIKDWETKGLSEVSKPKIITIITLFGGTKQKEIKEERKDIIIRLTKEYLNLV